MGDFSAKIDCAFCSCVCACACVRASKTLAPFLLFLLSSPPFLTRSLARSLAQQTSWSFSRCGVSLPAPSGSFLPSFLTMSAQAVVLVAAAGIAFAVPLPAQFFSTDTEQTIFRVLIVAAAALVVWRDDFGLFKQTPSSSSSSSSSSGVEKNRSEGGATTSATSTSGDAADADDSSPSSPSSSSSAALSKIKILYASTTGNAKSLAMALRKAVNTHTRKATATVGNLKDYEPEDLVNEKCVAVVVSTWTGGEPPRDAVFFDKFLTDAVLDFRRSKTMLEDLSFCVFGLGSSAYSKDVFCTAAKRIHRSLRRLGATPFAEIAFGDDAQGDMDAEFAEWVRSEVLPNFAKAQAKVSRAGGQNDSAADGPGAAPEGSAAKKPLSKRQARLLRQKQNEARYGPSRAKVARTAKKRQKMKPADLEEEDIINDTFLSLPERQEQEEAAAAAKEKARQEAAANLAAGTYMGGVIWCWSERVVCCMWSMCTWR